MRASRLVTLLGLLTTAGDAHPAELAAELEYRRTVLRDIEALSSAGIPVYATRSAGTAGSSCWTVSPATSQA